MKTIKQKILNNSVFVFFLVLISWGMAIYISVSSSNVPIMDYWRFINVLVEKSFTGGVTFFDLYANNGVHRSVYELFLFLVNVKLFHYNTQISMYVGILIMMCTSMIVYRQIKKICGNNKLMLNVISVISILMIYSLGAYEIIAQEFATPGALRILCFVIVCVATNNVIKEQNIEFNDKAVLLALYYIFVIDIIGGAYSIGLSITIAIVLTFDLVLRKKGKNKFCIGNYFVLYASLIAGDLLYLYGLQINQSGNGNASAGLMETLCSFFKGLFVVDGTCLFGTYLNVKKLIVLGIVVTIIHVGCFGIYLIKKMYKKTYLPACLYIYACGFYGMIFIGRSGNGLGYLASSRYITDAMFAVLADLLVIAMIYADSKINKQKIVNAICGVALCFFLSGVIMTDIAELKRAPYRKQYDDNLIQMMFQIEEYPDDELYLFQANSPEMVRSGIDIMKKYHLGVFRGE